MEILYNKFIFKKNNFLFLILFQLVFINKNYSNSINNDSIKNKNYTKIKTLFNDKEYVKSLKLGLSFLNKHKKEKDEYQYLINLTLGDIFFKLNNNEKSLIYYKEALKIIKEENIFLNEIKLKNKVYRKDNSLAEVLLKIGSLYHKLKKKDSANTYYKKVIEIPSFNNEVNSVKARVFNNLSGLFLEKNMFDSAKVYVQKSITIHKSQNQKIDEAAALGNLANIYLLEKNYSAAKETYFKGLDLIEKDNSSKSIKFKEDLYYNLAFALYMLKDYTAYDYQEKSYLIKDDLRDQEIRRTIEQIYARSKLDIEKEKTAFAEEQRKLLEAKDSKTTLLFGALSLLIIVISGVVVYNYKLRQRNLQLKLSESDLLQQQSIEKLKSDAQIKILNATIDGKETERKQIAETLHDNVSALLSSANMHLSATKKQFNGDTPQEIEKTRQIILEASQKVRDLSHNLISSILLKFGLEYALKDVVKKYSNSELAFEVKANNISRYNQEFEIKIFNVIQELINNIIKHSNANNAEIILKAENNQLTILVKDDGVGFATSSSSINDGIGLNQIEARIKMMNGKLAIDSEPDKGTEVFILVPIQQQKEYGSLSSVS
ncbi:ATP-binding protein [uncultured Tenacibaculum sp.]|uniref:tetratricopeptide repeat-containing sensor histidine kinase n=1 Tax=uncultured Tenacibaculum sp. TaxID=174713 RepID=UPI002624CB4D|nr:ATP-binding protein [uncultured Tenacibaculum sp.]